MMESNKAQKKLGANECYRVVWSTDGKEFFSFFSKVLEQSGPQTRFGDCRVFVGQGAYKLGTHTFKQGSEVWYAYVEPVPVWWDAPISSPAKAQQGHAK